MAGRIAVGIIRKAHGVRGEASVEPLTPSPDRFRELTAVTLLSPDESRSIETVVEGARTHGDRALVKFRDFHTPEEILTLQNWTVEIPQEQTRALEEGEYFLHDLAGLHLVDAQGRDRGVVEEAYEGGGGVLLRVKGPAGEFEVPFAAEICTEVDLAAGRIQVNLPQGLDNLDDVED